MVRATVHAAEQIRANSNERERAEASRGERKRDNSATLLSLVDRSSHGALVIEEARLCNFVTYAPRRQASTSTRAYYAYIGAYSGNVAAESMKRENEPSPTIFRCGDKERLRVEGSVEWNIED